jgi:hypothetical protein
LSCRIFPVAETTSSAANRMLTIRSAMNTSGFLPRGQF